MKLSPYEKASLMIKKLPQIKDFLNQTVVIKYGGNAMTNEALKEVVIKDIVLMKFIGMNPVVVHGGGPEITNMMKKVGKEAEFVNGLRVTDRETMEITEKVLFGKINKEIVSFMKDYGTEAISINGKKDSMIQAKQKDPKLGFVGEVDQVNTDILEKIIAEGKIPVISPTACGKDGETYNINADEVAGRVAAAIGAKKLILITDVDGVMMDQHDTSSIISHIKTKEIRKYIEDQIIGGGMIPKIQCCFDAVTCGVEKAHIIDGRKPKSMLLKIFTNESVGTMITD
ncbi:N-acetylglutamate kinase [Natronincola peptidivorans]|uniref:Acetylglutamate kinase n=1 Tax=Natronincola peptidivorans TaxID=426128 RepID=A0A1I0G5C3_9FIRM|nr:acetylglutamate kinase [Natronincola peptidivorans]SET65806.1 N-acetylglutamate kinase [Natronincola peptidivorans]